MTSSDNTHLKDLLAGRALKATPGRLELLSLIEQYNSAMPFSQIQARLKKVDRVTLYRTIQSLLDKGIIHKAMTDDKETFYALCGTTCSSHDHVHNHVHFKCNNCERISCEKLENEVTISLPDFVIASTQIHLTGICRNCN